ncbi:Beta-2-glycoprotein I [Phaffia rhodozyma]|uniref:Beta-2-glycoprotein I n=1 Tax=Phaffia rhodozyma TaxID=264483 RepID=A0A0F7SI49_PHARH|nr:Beta-2-glycoprotein I [Phaffia rhodozyma]
MPISRVILHLAALSYTSWGYQKLSTLVFAKYFGTQYGGMTQFLTILGLYASQICMGTSILADLTGAKVLKKAKRVLLLISLPVETVVSAVYWPLVLIAPFLLVPELNEDVSSFDPTVPTFIKIPIYIDLALHAAPGATLLTDFFFFEKPYLPPQSTTGALYATILLATGYASWAEWCALQNNGVFPYPFLTISPLPVRGAIYAGAAWAALAFFRFVNRQKINYSGGIANGHADGNAKIK